MKLPARHRQPGLRFNITPLIDVVFLLIIFFLAATHFVRSETHEPVELTRVVKADEDAEEHPRRLIITVTADGRLHVGGKTSELSAVEAMVLSGAAAHAGGFEVRIRADHRAAYRHVQPLLLACARAGVTAVKFAVLPE